MNEAPLRVLIVEDDERFARTVERLLSARAPDHYRWTRAATLGAGLKSLGDESFDVILLDLGLPDSAGLETLARIGERAGGVPIIVLTGLYDESMAANAFKLGAMEFFIKSDADADSLRRAIHYALERGSVQHRLQESNRRLRSISRRLVEVQEAERRGIAREMHDEVGQLLTALQVKLEMASRAGESAPLLQECRQLLSELTSRVRDLSLTLRPPVLDDLGLLPALLWQFDRYNEQTGITVDFVQSNLSGGATSPELETAAFRIVQEALTNAARHAKVDRVSVRFNLSREQLEFAVEDRGAGFDADAVLDSPGSFGLSGIQERAALLGGKVSIESSPGSGTRIRAWFRLDEPAEKSDN